MYANSRDISLEQAIVRSPLMIAANATIGEAIALMSKGNQTCNLLFDTLSAEATEILE